MINFEVFLVGKVPKSSVFNRDCLETIYFWICKIMKIQNGSNKKNRVFAASGEVCSGQLKLCLRHGFCRN